MANLTTTDIDLAPIMWEGAEFENDTFTAGGAGTIVAGTILARDSVSLKYVVYVKGGATNENGIPKAVLTYDLEAAGAGDLPVRAAVRGTARLQKLVIDADGNSSNIDKAVQDELRDFGITPVSVDELNIPDNQ